MKYFLSLSTAALLLIGCTAPAPQAPSLEAPGEGWIRNSQEETAMFLATDNALGKLVEISNLVPYSTHEGGLKVICQLHNLTPQPLAIQIRALFRQNDGTTVEESAWKSVTLPVGKFIPFEATNESGLAGRVLVQMRLKDTVQP